MTAGPRGVAPDRSAPAARRAVLLVLLVAAVLVQVVVLYAPSSGADPPFVHADKVVHLVVFLVPVVLALAAGLRPPLVAAVFAGHAVLSEIVQHLALESRSGDVLDLIADLAGVAIGLLLWHLVPTSP